MSNDVKLIFRIIGSLVLLLWLLALLRKMYYNPTSEARFLFGFIIIALAGRLVTLWLDFQIFPSWDNAFSVVFNNFIFLGPAWFYFQKGSEDKNAERVAELSNLDRRAQIALEISDARLKCSN